MKTALITGASTGLGKSIAKKLAAQNYTVILLARNEKLLKQNCEEINNTSGTAHYYQCDITNKKQVATVIEAISKKFHTIDMLINNAGVWTDDEIQKNKPDQLNTAIETNLLGQIYIIETVLPIVTKTSVARILSVISTAAVLGIPAGDNRNWKTYGASKWGLKGYTNALKESLRDTNVQVIQFYPGGFESDLYENAKRSNAHNQPWMMQTNDVADIAVFALTRPDDVYMEEVVVSKYIQ